MDADKKMMDFTVAEACQTSLQPQGARIMLCAQQDSVEHATNQQR